MSSVPRNGNVNPQTGEGEYDIFPETQALEDVINQQQPQDQRMVIEVESVVRPRSKWQSIKVGTAVLVVAGVIGGGAFLANKLFNSLKDVAPKPETTFDIDEYRQAVSSENTVATGQITSEAEVSSTYSFLAGSAECEGTITGHQTFTMRPQEDGNNIEVNEKNGKEVVVIELEENVVEVDRQVISLPNPNEICEANVVGRQGIFNDESKAFKPIATEAPGIFEGRTEVQNPAELLALNNGEMGMQLASAAAATYDAIGNRLFELTDVDMEIVFTYNGEEVVPNSSNQLDVDVQADRIKLGDQ